MSWLQLLCVAALGLGASYLLWVFFLSVMMLRIIRDAAQLVGPIKYPAYLTLGIGYSLDAAVNVFPCTLVFWELPRFAVQANGKREWTVSERTKRLAQSQGWRGAISRYLRVEFLKKADSSGGHD